MIAFFGLVIIGRRDILAIEQQTRDGSFYGHPRQKRNAKTVLAKRHQRHGRDREADDISAPLQPAWALVQLHERDDPQKKERQQRGVGELARRVDAVFRPRRLPALREQPLGLALVEVEQKMSELAREQREPRERM